MRVKFLMFTACLFFGIHAVAGERWQPYPPELTRFAYSEQNLGEHWQALTDGFRGPLPTAQSLKADAERWPDLYDYTRTHLQSVAASQPQLAHLSEGELSEHFDAYATELRRAWSLLFNGQFREARDLGLNLGPAGYFPGLYAQALYATLIVKDEAERRTLLEEVVSRTNEILPMAPDHPMIRFGRAYGKARILEGLSATEAMGTGFTSDVLENLEELLDEDPNNIYAITLMAGVQSGIIEKAGGFVARMTYGAKASTMESLFQQALQLTPDYPGVYYEYARAKLKVYDDDGQEAARELLEQASAMTPSSAEEALMLQAAAQMRQHLSE